MKTLVIVLGAIAVAFFLPGGIFLVGGLIAKLVKKWSARRKFAA